MDGWPPQLFPAVSLPLHLSPTQPVGPISPLCPCCHLDLHHHLKVAYFSVIPESLTLTPKCKLCKVPYNASCSVLDCYLGTILLLILGPVFVMLMTETVCGSIYAKVHHSHEFNTSTTGEWLCLMMLNIQQYLRLQGEASGLQNPELISRFLDSFTG